MLSSRDERAARTCSEPPNQPTSLRLLTAVRALWGAALLIAPDTVLTRLPHQDIDRPDRIFARVLGARHVIQAAITNRCDTRHGILTGAAVDATHATATAILARLAPARRTLALTDVAIAAALAGAGILASQDTRADPGRSIARPRLGLPGAGAAASAPFAHRARIGDRRITGACADRTSDGRA